MKNPQELKVEGIFSILKKEMIVKEDSVVILNLEIRYLKQLSIALMLLKLIKIRISI